MSTKRITPSLRFSLLAIIISLILHARGAKSGVVQPYCSKLNTGDANSKGSYIYQSNGWCSGLCGGFAFAIVQADSCWCSNFAPGNSVDGGTFCNKTCPGFPTDRCGDGSAGYFGYIALAAAASGTVNPTTSTTGNNGNGKTAAPVATAAPTPIASVQVITVSGAIVTQTVTTMPTAAAVPIIQEKKKSSVSSGVIAGAAIGSAAGFAVIIGLIFFFLRRRRENDAPAEYNTDAEGSSKRTSPRRNVSVLSKMGLLERTQPVITRTSANDGDSNNGTSPMTERRSSHPRFYDQRLNPNALMEHDNGSRASVMTMEDNRDYTRTLGVRNPDPRPSFEGH